MMFAGKIRGTTTNAYLLATLAALPPSTLIRVNQENGTLDYYEASENRWIVFMKQ